MDINSLLSPQDPPAQRAAVPAPAAAPKRSGRPVGGKRTASTLSQEITISPSPEAPTWIPHLGHHTGTFAQQQQQQQQHQAQRSLGTPAYSSAAEPRSTPRVQDTPGLDFRSPFGSPPNHRASLAPLNQRRISNPHSETLADVASAQHRQQRKDSDAQAQRSPSIVARSTAPPNNRSLSGLSSSDLAMAEAPAQTPPPRNFTASSLSEADLKTINELAQYLADNSYAYDSHVQLIALLHQGFISHVHPLTANGQVTQRPADYSLLSDLRQARQAMQSRFAVGEALWEEWIEDESLLAASSEDRSTVMELCIRAVQEEPASVALWKLYGEWVWSTYAIARDITQGDSDQWTIEDKMICHEVFTRDLVLNVWSQAVEATKWRIDESHLIWDRYVELITQDFPEKPSLKTVEEIRTLYMMRLQIPHAAWESTSQAFWPIISKYNAEGWEEIMSATNEMAAPAKQQLGLREVHEQALSRASDAGDKPALYHAFVEYLKWERKERKHKQKQRVPFDADLRCGLYERALLRFPTTIEWWQDYLDYRVNSNISAPMLSVLERATRHCPWSGDLWSRRLLRAEFEGVPYDEVENIKHKATNSVLLDLGGMEEIIKVYSAWCGYLRRRAFDPNDTDDEMDMADMGITGALEDVQVAGRKIHGPDFKGDPLWRIEKIRITFLTQARRIDDAREVFRRLVPVHGASYDFWSRYYHFELIQWGLEWMAVPSRSESTRTALHRATAVLREAAAQKNLDWPERILEVYANHVQTHESADELQKAAVAHRALTRQVQQRRAREAEEAATAGSQTQHVAETMAESDSATTKRKRDDEAVQQEEINAKRNKTEVEAAATLPDPQVSASASAQVKRDREHNTITVKNLPADVTEKRIRQLFADCGKVLSVEILAEADAMTATATVEFESNEDVLSAKTRDGKDVDGNAVKIQSGTLSTLYVTNYPADFDETKIRELFHDYGTITSVRFPSLKFNQRRRFCYVQYLTTEEARGASKALHDKAIDGQHRLVALISDPEAKKSRQGATAEGRELHVGNVEHGATEEEIRDFFQAHGTVENVRMIKGTNGRFTGTVFIIYSTGDEANAALALNNKPLKTRLLRVSLATDKSSRDANNQKQGGTTVIRQGSEPSPAPASSAGSPPAEGATNGRRGSIASDQGTTEDTAKTKRQRTVALLNVPDTVNEARIQSLLEVQGPLRKVVMRRDKGGAMVEFVNLEDAGKVGMLRIDCTSLGPDCRIGQVGELLSIRATGKTAGGARDGSVQEKKSSAPPMRPAQAGVSRPGQRGGKRGGLGFKSGGFRAGSSKAAGDDAEMGEVNGQTAKSNADFRAMFVKSADAGAE